MIDIHSHILPGIDDGPKELEESLEILRKASENGVTHIIATPHFIFGSEYNADNKLKRSKVVELNKIIKKEKLNTTVILGNEVFVENDLLELLRKGKITTLNKSNYILFELPMRNNYKGIDELIFRLKNKGYTPILAHPERYLQFKKDPNLIIPLLEKGVLLQSNIGSFFERYGKDANSLVLLLLKHHAITFISSDIHNKRDNYYDKIDELKQILKKYCSDEEIEDLLENNAKKVLENKKIESIDITPFKKGILGKWK